MNIALFSHLSLSGLCVAASFAEDLKGFNGSKRP
jgi:hypothetical protein